ncbi:hypothetical protein SAMN06265222_117110 [Neorhodopirellula lusitana]|uniref:Uncharacterized protein n=1 Tax=Neorhodopirellula lusitana TaxID=445327 RepID=A0ABY1QKK1_9BACT|nr:hypothetical protein [Neorhodopirellula lusitana]SMP74326.1 hypothetical protein SAMN06265222_117110 [Neorhodopirellula lusitana]
MFGRWVEFEFDCLPLRSLGRLDVPLDASPAYEAFVLKVKAALSKHGAHNTYFLHHAICRFHLTNDPNNGQIEFQVEGVVMTGENDIKTKAVDLNITLSKETCPWLNEPSVEFLAESVKHAVAIEFDRYIQAGDLTKTKERIDAMSEQIEEGDGFQAMYL